MPKLSRRRLMDLGLVGGAALTGTAFPFGRSHALMVQPMDRGVQALYEEACQTRSHHDAALTALVEAARARDIAIDEGALRRLLDGTPCPLCGCTLTAG